MTATADEILVGANGKVWVTDTDQTMPTDSDTAMGSVDSAWIDLGYVSDEGVNFSDTKEIESIMAWQSFYPIRRIVTGRDATLSFTLRQWNPDTLAFALGGGAIYGPTQVITLTGFAGTDSFKLTYNAVETVAFVRQTNATAAAIQTALRTATGDTGLTVTGTTDEGPFTVVFTGGWDALAITVTSPVGCTGAVTRSETKYEPPSPEDIDERALVVEWTDGVRDYRLLMPKGMVTEAVETNIVRTNAADLPITFAATPAAGGDAYTIFTNDAAFA